jgi:hypothetical protein
MIMCRGCCKDFPDDDVFVCNCENAEPYCANCSCPVCNHNGTGEVEMIHDPAIVMERNASAGEVPDVRFSRTSEPLSNSEQLAKPEMPERIWAKRGEDWKYKEGVEIKTFISGSWQGSLPVIKCDETAYLRADKVREAIKKAIEMDIAQGFWLSTPTTYADYDIRKKDYQLKKKQFANIVIFLFPEGVEDKEDK